MEDPHELPQDRRRSASALESSRYGPPWPLMNRLLHDVNNALSVVTVNAGLLAEETHADDPALELVGEILDAARQAATLARELRRIVQVSSGGDSEERR